jgi:hypothetical protein
MSEGQRAIVEEIGLTIAHCPRKLMADLITMGSVDPHAACKRRSADFARHVEHIQSAGIRFG